MDIALLPLRLGAGIKIKVLECMSAGLAVITTPVGIEGIAAVDGVEYLLGNTPEELAQHVIRMLNEPEACREIGAKGREFVAREFDFEASAERFGDELISRIESARKTDPLRPNRRHFG
jgi:glycosyltransferase involved in cell wall biosynthesis